MTGQSVLATEWARYAVTVDASDPAYDPTVAAAVAFSFRQSGHAPTVSDWTAGSWETFAGPPRRWIARVLVGPGGAVTLDRGEWTVWIRITDGAEVVTRAVDTISIT